MLMHEIEINGKDVKPIGAATSRKRKQLKASKNMVQTWAGLLFMVNFKIWMLSKFGNDFVDMMGLLIVFFTKSW